MTKAKHTDNKQATDKQEEQERPVIEPHKGEEHALLPSLEGQIKTLEEEASKYKDLYLRAMAETENTRTRAKRENEDTAKYATTKFARDMVNILENLVRASNSITPQQRAENDMIRQVGEGIDMTVQELTGIFERNGIKRIDPKGEKFDHNFHQAVAQVESNEVPPGTVMEVLQAGYILHDRLLRPAMVSVAKEAAASETSAA